MGESGDDLIREAGGGIVAVEVEYRLGIFGTYSSSPLMFPVPQPYIFL